MRVVLKDKNTEAQIELSLETVNPNSYGNVDIEGDRATIDTFRDIAETLFGAFGHRFDLELTTAIDLNAALRDQKVSEVFEVLESEGEPLSYDPEIPEGAVT